MINKLIDLEKDLRLSEEFIAFCKITNSPRNMNICRDEGWFKLMENMGFLVDDKFLPIIDIISKTKNMAETERVFTLESVGCDLSRIAKLVC
jgi:hypothetical protein